MSCKSYVSPRVISKRYQAADLGRLSRFCFEVRTGTSICHAQQERLLVYFLKVLVLELLSVDALTTRSVAHGEVTASVSHALPSSQSRESPTLPGS
jgi:hypothetical protein